MNKITKKMQIFNTWWRIIDQPTLISIIMLMCFSIILIKSTSYSVASKVGLPENYFSIRQPIYLLISSLMIFALSFLNKKHIILFSLINLCILICLMFITPYFGHEIKGAKRWINIFYISIQPSEFIKPFFSIVVGWFLFIRTKKKFPGLKLSVLLYSLVAIGLVLQPDFGSLILFTTTFIIQLFISGIPIIFLIIMFVITIIGLINTYIFVPHFALRIQKYLNPKISENYQVNKSIIAFKNGSIYGQGPGEGKIKEHIADSHTDFIFAVSGEEFGLIISAMIISIFLFIIIRTLIKLYASNDLFVQISVSGIISQFGLQSAINIGVTLNLLPTKGMTLPFISYGGSSIIAMGIMFGILLSLTKRTTSLVKYRNNKIIYS